MHSSHPFERVSCCDVKCTLKGYGWLQVLQKALANESRAKEAINSQKSNEKPNHTIYAWMRFIRTMMVKMFTLLSLFGPLMINLALVALSS